MVVHICNPRCTRKWSEASRGWGGYGGGEGGALRLYLENKVK
jgi:hypothetical protein